MSDKGYYFLFWGIIFILVIFDIIFSFNFNAALNNKVISGKGKPVFLLGKKDGDIYLDKESDYLYQKEYDSWNFIGEINYSDDGNVIYPIVEISKNGFFKINGKKTKIYAGSSDKINELGVGKNGNWYIDGTDTSICALSCEKVSDIYIGYEGFVWNGNERTKYKVNLVDNNIIESTLLLDDKSKYFDYDYISLKDKYIALMPYFKKNSLLTLYSESLVEEISFYANEKGTLYIGTAKVSDILDSRLNGNNLKFNGNSYHVDAGFNTIKVDLRVLEYETVVIGNSENVKLCFVKGVNNDDVSGNFTLINNKVNKRILSQTDNLNDKLIISTKGRFAFEEKVIFDSIKEELGSGISKGNDIVFDNDEDSFSYRDTSLFSGKTISRIGVPVSKVEELNDEQYFSLYVIDKNFLEIGETVKKKRSFKVYLPREELGNNKQVNKWIYVDVKDLNIKVYDNEHLSFGSINDNVTLVYKEKFSDKYSFYSNVFGELNANHNASMYIDIYYDISRSKDEQLDILEQKENASIVRKEKIDQLSSLLSDKNVSILGDSISTYKGYTNDYKNYNSTMGNNRVYYNGKNYLTSIDQIWWKYVINSVEANVLVPNAYSGDRVIYLGGARALELHDDTGENAGTNPDIIFVYLGINDFDGKVSVNYFEEKYDSMIKSMSEKYSEANIFLLNFVPNDANNRTVDDLLNYNNIVLSTAKKYDAIYVDLYTNSGITENTMCIYSSDERCLHPNVEGMKLIGDTLLDSMIDYYLD